MVAFPKPAFSYEYEVDAQIAALREYEQTKPGRAIPPKTADRILIATWNIANLGVQERRDKDYRLIAEILGMVRPDRSAGGQRQSDRSPRDPPAPWDRLPPGVL